MKSYVMVIFMLIAVIFTGCSDKIASETEEKKPETVATIDNGKITIEDFTNYVKSRPIQQAGKSADQLAEAYLDDIISEEVLFQEAMRLKLDQDPQIKSNIRRMLSQKLLEDQVRSKLLKGDIDEKTLQQYYDKYRDEFNRPEQVRLADIFIAVPPDANEVQKTELKKKADLVLAEAKQAIQRPNGFMPLVQKYSDTHKKYPKGNTGFFNIEGNPVGIDKNLAQAAFTLQNAGDLMDHVIETPDGFHIIQLAGKRPAVSKALGDVSDILKQRIRQEEYPQKSKEYVEGLKKQMKIEIDKQKIPEMVKTIEEMKEKNPQMQIPGGRQLPSTGQGASVKSPAQGMAPFMPQQMPGQMGQPKTPSPMQNAPAK